MILWSTFSDMVMQGKNILCRQDSFVYYFRQTNISTHIFPMCSTFSHIHANFSSSIFKKNVFEYKDVFLAFYAP